MEERYIPPSNTGSARRSGQMPRTSNFGGPNAAVAPNASNRPNAPNAPNMPNRPNAPNAPNAPNMAGWSNLHEALHTGSWRYGNNASNMSNAPNSGVRPYMNENTAGRSNAATMPNAAGRSNAATMPNTAGRSNAATMPNTAGRSNAATMPNTAGRSNAATMPNTAGQSNAATMPNTAGRSNTGVMPNTAGRSNAATMPNAPNSLYAETAPNVASAPKPETAPFSANAPNTGAMPYRADKADTLAGRECDYRSGQLPTCAPLAAGFVPFQQESVPRYENEEALTKGTLFPGLDLPFMNVANKSNPYAGTPLGDLMALGFVIKELNLYLDTHPNDRQALESLQSLNMLMETAHETFVEKYGPITIGDVTSGKEYSWINDPWPWEFTERWSAK